MKTFQEIRHLKVFELHLIHDLVLQKAKITKSKRQRVDENVYQVDSMLNMRKDKLEFEIKWLGYKETTWEGKTNLQGEAH